MNNMKYARIDLEETNYATLSSGKVITYANPRQLHHVYRLYCEHKQFESVMPLFDSQFNDPNIDVMCYYGDDNTIIAFSLIRRHDKESVESLQFAWDYANPRLRLGIESLKHECAYYKAQGYKYFYLGGADEYKSKIDGFKILGPL